LTEAPHIRQLLAFQTAHQLHKKHSQFASHCSLPSLSPLPSLLQSQHQKPNQHQKPSQLPLKPKSSRKHRHVSDDPYKLIFKLLFIIFLNQINSLLQLNFNLHQRALSYHRYTHHVLLFEQSKDMKKLPESLMMKLLFDL
jgi:hypothetical protein